VCPYGIDEPDVFARTGPVFGRTGNRPEENHEILNLPAGAALPLRWENQAGGGSCVRKQKELPVSGGFFCFVAVDFGLVPVGARQAIGVGRPASTRSGP